MTLNIAAYIPNCNWYSCTSAIIQTIYCTPGTKNWIIYSNIKDPLAILSIFQRRHFVAQSGKILQKSAKTEIFIPVPKVQKLKGTTVQQQAFNKN